MLGIPDFVRVITEEENRLMEKEGDVFSYKDISVSFKTGDNLEVFLEAEHTGVKYVSLRFNREWKKNVLFYGDDFERAYGDLRWEGFEFERIMYWYVIASAESLQEAFGCKTGPDSIVFFTTDPEGLSVWLDVRNGAAPVLLNGRKLKAATLCYMKKDCQRSEVGAFMHAFCRSLCDNPIFPDCPVYGSNNWYYAYGDSSAEEIVNDTKILVEHTQGLENRPFMVIDDCWQPLARAGKAMGRPIDRGNELFPDMKGLADKIKEMGARPGIWFRPLKTAERFIDRSVLLKRDETYMDPSCEKTLELVAQDVNRLTKEWGYELIKHDFTVHDAFGDYCRTDKRMLSMKDWSFSDRTKTSAEILKRLYKTIHDNANGAVIIGCNVSGHLAAGHIHIHRSGDDTSGRIYERSVKYGINCLAFRYHQHKAFFDIDADCVCVTNLIPWEKNRDITELYAKSSTPFFASVSPDAVTPEISSALKEAFKTASFQKTGFEPLDWFENNIPKEYLIDGKSVRYSWMCREGKEFPYT